MERSQFPSLYSSNSLSAKEAQDSYKCLEGLVDSIVSDLPISAGIPVVDRDSDRIEFQELDIEVNLEKVLESYAQAEKFWEQEENDQS